MGAEAVALAIRELADDEATHVHQQVVFDAELVIGESTRRPDKQG
jgi:DNA-binding LacI/PurR family transcriptional regulator